MSKTSPVSFFSQDFLRFWYFSFYGFIAGFAGFDGANCRKRGETAGLADAGAGTGICLRSCSGAPHCAQASS